MFKKNQRKNNRNSTKKIANQVCRAGSLLSYTEEMLLNQRGVSDEISASIMLPNDKKNLIDDFIKTKKSYSNENINQTIIFPDAIETIDELTNRRLNVWICTSAKEGFVKKYWMFSQNLT